MSKINNSWHSNISNKNHEEIVQAGKELFLKKNFLNIKITDICSLAGVSRVTFYKYFKNMDELIFEVQINILNSMTEFVKDRSNLTATGKESVKSVLYSWKYFAKGYKDEMKFIALFDTYYSSYDLNEDLKIKYKSFIIGDIDRNVLRYALEKGFNDGSLKMKSYEECLKMGAYIYQTFMGLLQRTSYTNFAVECELITFDDVVVQVVDMIIRSIESNSTEQIM
ncbi:TetR/AcrR family transcriptional regulator [Clostridium sp.]